MHKLASPLPSPVTVTVTLKITQAKVFHSVGDGSDGKIAQGGAYCHPCHFEQVLTTAVPHKLCKLAAFKNVCGLSYYTDSNVHQRKRAPFRMLSESIMGKNFQSV